MRVTKHALSPPSLEEIAQVLASSLPSNYLTSSSSVVQCPDLRKEPFNLAFKGLGGSEVVADIGGQANLYPLPRPERQFSLIECAELMGLPPGEGAILGAGAGPSLIHGTPSELVPHLSWHGGYENLINKTWSARLVFSANGEPSISCPASDSTMFGLMMNLYGSTGLTGNVIRVTAKGRKGSIASFTVFMRYALREAYGDPRQIALGGVFIIKKGRARYHVMPPFPPQDELPFRNQAALDDWLSYHVFDGPMVCLTVFHSADPDGLGVRLEHTHCFSNVRDEGGHYHYDLEGLHGSDEVEYEGYFNTAETCFQMEKPGTS